MNLNTNEKTNLKNNFIGNSSKCSLSDSVNNFQYLERLSQHQLLQQTERLVGSERKLTYQILRYLQEIEKRRLFLTIGYGSMFDYLTKHLKYSESAAYRRLQAARLLNENQSLAKKLQDGRLNLSQMVKIQQSLKSVIQRSHSLDHTKETKSRGQQPFKRKPIPRKMKLHLLKEARYSCQYVDQLTHKKCSSCYQLQIDHIVPIAKGGSNELTNLRILCAAHNRSEAVRWGLKKRDI